MKKTKYLGLLIVAGLAACGHDIAYRPAPQILPANIKKLSIRMPVNKTQQFGLEDKLSLRIRDEFLRDGRYPLLPENDADGVALVTISRYLLTPISYDAQLIPTAYKLRIMADLQFLDRRTNTALWEEKNMEGIQVFPASTLPGGKTEEQAREAIWDVLGRDIVKRVVDGFGTVTGTSQRRVNSDAPSTEPAIKSPEKLAPVNPNPY